MIVPFSARRSLAAPRRRLDGFSLIELLVALTLAAVVLAVAMGTLSTTFRYRRVSAERSQLVREAAFAQQVINSVLRQAGLGVPPGPRIDDNTIVHPAVLLVGQTTALGIVADLPRPHTQYETFGYLGSVNGGDDQTLWWFTENSGNCQPLDVGGCDMEKASFFFPGMAAEVCTSSGDQRRMCPWGMRRIEQNDRFQIVSGQNDWTLAVFDITAGSAITGSPELFLQLDTAWDDPTGVWPGTVLGGTGPHEVAGLGYVTTVDRWFLRRSGNRLERKQCWGDPEPLNGDWPDEATSGLPTNPESGVSNTTCFPSGDTGFETLINDVVDFRLTYFDATGAEVVQPIDDAAKKSSVRRVDYFLTVQKVVFGDNITHDVVGSVAFRNPI